MWNKWSVVNTFWMHCKVSFYVKPSIIQFACLKNMYSIISDCLSSSKWSKERRFSDGSAFKICHWLLIMWLSFWWQLLNSVMKVILSVSTWTFSYKQFHSSCFVFSHNQTQHKYKHLIPVKYSSWGVDLGCFAVTRPWHLVAIDHELLFTPISSRVKCEGI